MHHNVDAVERPHKALAIAYIANEVANRRVIITAGTHLVLLELITAVDNDFSGVIFLEHNLNKLFAEGPCPPGD